MRLAGLGALEVLALFSGASALATALYFLKLRRRTITVPFVRLWDSILAEERTTRLFSHLKRWLSLLLALALIAALSLSLGDPRPVGSSSPGRTVVVLVDVSASMQATDVSPSRLEAGLEHVRALIDGLAAADRMLIATLGRKATPVGPMSSDPRLLRAAIDSIVPTDSAAALRPGLALARDALRGAEDAELVIVTDGSSLEHELTDEAQPALSDDVRLAWIRVGEASENIGIVRFAVRRYPLDKSQSEVLIEIENPSDRPRRVELELFGDGQSIDVQRIDLASEERVSRFLGNIAGADATLEARLSPMDGLPDFLAADDRAFARLPPRRRGRVLVVSDGNLYLEAALLLDEYLDVTMVGPDDYDPSASHDVVIFDRWVPETTPDKPALYLSPLPREGGVSPLEASGTIERPFFDRIDRRHPLVRFAALRDVNVADALALRAGPGDRVVAASTGGPLLVEGQRNGVPFVVLAFDVRRSDLPLRVAWPLLLLNTIDFFLEGDGDFRSSYEAGEAWHVPVPEGVAEVSFRAPDGSEAPAPVVEGRAVYSGARAGFYQLIGENFEEVIAANIGPGNETKITPAGSLSVEGRDADDPTRGTPGTRELYWLYLVAAALVVLFVEWALYHRRWTV